jgi:hypothetical protein
MAAYLSVYVPNRTASRILLVPATNTVTGELLGYQRAGAVPSVLGMTTTTAPPPARATSRLLAAAPIDDPDAFSRTIAALTGRSPRLEDVQGFVGRNDNWRVPTPPDGDLFVKCLRGTADQVANRMARVAAFERLVADAPPETFRTPAYHGADELRGMLVFDCLPDSRAASDLFADDELEPATVFQFGRVIAEIHRLPHTSIGVDDHASRAATSFYALDPESYANCSGGEVEAWAMLQHDKVVLQSLATMQTSSAQAPSVASHGDLRLDQFLLAGSDSGSDVYLVDWEEFRYGDPARDVGAVVGEFIHHAASRMFAELDVESGLAPGAAHEAIMVQGQQQLDKVAEHVNHFWAGYISSIDTSADPGLAVRATGYAGWHFFDRLLAGASHGAKLSAAQRGMAGIGRNALTDPERYAPVIGLR